MRIRILPYAAAYQEAVRAFTARLHAGVAGSPASLSSIRNLLLSAEDCRPGDEFLLAVDENQVVRGTYILRHQEFWIGDRVARAACYCLPVSEGIVDRAYTSLGVPLLLDALRRQPLLYGLGMGGYHERLPQLLAAAGWRMITVPFYLYIAHPDRFLHNIAYLRRSPLRARAFDLLAGSGLGWLGIKAFQALHRPRARSAPVGSETVGRFSEGIDELWETCKSRYALCAVRNRAVLDLLYPAANERFLRLEVRRGRRLIGWAVLLDTQLARHKYFGDMRLGSIADCLADPADAHTVVACARQVLEDAGADLIVSNQSHGAWRRALRDCGFLQGPSNFLLGTSRELTRVLRGDGRDMPLDQMHFNRGDGDGPINL
ncbi:MAG: hypothetical protein ABSG86_11600 [Thermoguttaceae bacterium]|jgi:hypothetical protein